MNLKYLLKKKTKIPVGIKSNFQDFIFKDTRDSPKPNQDTWLNLWGHKG